MRLKSAPIPKPSDLTFVGNIAHPDLWLWDSWTMSDQGEEHLFCLAVPKRDHDQQAIPSETRNDFAFHIRQFVSQDGGQSWNDRGAFLEPSSQPASYYRDNVWSGCAQRLADGNLFYGFTGIRHLSDDRRYLQSIGCAVAKEQGSALTPQAVPISCPLRDYDMIRDAGYYLGPKDQLGSDHGEGGGPIMAWRDPFAIQEPDGRINLYWSAKLGPTTGAIARAIVEQQADEFELIELCPPIELPGNYTQCEVPKVYHDAASQRYWMLTAGCDRMFEGQPDADVRRDICLYTSSNLQGPWQAFSDKGASITDAKDLFGASVLTARFQDRQLELICPVTEVAKPLDRFTIAGPLTHTLHPSSRLSRVVS